MSTREGPLSKWTNVMKGWQYRWFVLEGDLGNLSYYISKEKRIKGFKRGTITLKGAIIGIDEEDDSSFTITVEGKTFHFQARDLNEKESWIIDIQNSIDNQLLLNHRGRDLCSDSLENFEQNLLESDRYLQLLINSVQNLEDRIEKCTDEENANKLRDIRDSSQNLIETVKQSIVLLQMAKQNIVDIADNNVIDLSNLDTDFSTVNNTNENSNGKPDEKSKHKNGFFKNFFKKQASGTDNRIPSTFSENSSDNEDIFHDTVDTITWNPIKRYSKEKNEKKEINIETTTDLDIFNQYYENIHNDVDSSTRYFSFRNIIKDIAKQALTKELSKITLPAFILERRSLLEMFADFLAHPDLWLNISKETTHEKRMISCIRWYLSAFHAGRNPKIVKKPYNPVLGEVFKCTYDMDDYFSNNFDKIVENGPIKGVKESDIAVVAEQVSHHPPISAFYAENVANKMSLNAHIYTKSKSTVISFSPGISVSMIGKAVLTLIEHNETYTITFPAAYGRDVIYTPWTELGGKTEIRSSKGYVCYFEFVEKARKKEYNIECELFTTDSQPRPAPILRIEGDYYGKMYSISQTDEKKLFLDTSSLQLHKKNVSPISEQETYESRRLWRFLTYYLAKKDFRKAEEHKWRVEQKQRDEVKLRLDQNIIWKQRLFQEIKATKDITTNEFLYMLPLNKRLRED